MDLVTDFFVLDPEAIDVRELESYLQRYGVPYENWGKQPRTKTLAELAESMRKGECYVEQNHRGLVLHWHVAVVLVHRIIDQDIFTLHKDRQELADNQRFKRPFKGIGEKIIHGESPEAAARRGLAEELGQTEPLFKEVSRYELRYSHKVDTDPAPSDWFRPLVDIYHRHIFHVLDIDPVLYHEEYIETKSSGRRIFFRWRKDSG